jgi:hypothetical protein
MKVGCKCGFAFSEQILPIMTNDSQMYQHSIDFASCGRSCSPRDKARAQPKDAAGMICQPFDLKVMPTIT